MLKRLVGLLLVVGMVFGLIGTTHSTQAKGNCRTTGYGQYKTSRDNRGPKLYMNGNKVSFREEFGRPFIDKANRTQIPFRAFSESCSFNVTWDGKARVGYAKRGSMTVGIPVDKDYITVNGKVVSSDTKNVIINGRIHLPLRVVLESFGYDVKWDGENKCIYITSDKTPDASSEEGDSGQAGDSSDEGDTPDDTDENKGDGQPDQDVPDNPSDKDNNEEPNNQPDNQGEPVVTSEEALRGIHIGDDVSKVTSSLGNPSAQQVSGYGFTWYIYKNDYTKYVQIGIMDNKVVALYTNASYWALTDGVRYGASADTVKTSFGASYSYGMLTATKDNLDYTFYVDKIDQQKVVAVRIMDKAVKGSSYYAKASSDLRTSYEKQVFYLTNVERVNKGLEAFLWKDDVATVSRAHSKDMSDQDYFDHTNLQGEAPWDRAKKAGITYSYYGENIAMGQQDALHVVNGWMNSSGHRKNILSNNYTGLGVGVWFNSKNAPYYTQNFMK